MTSADIAADASDFGSIVRAIVGLTRLTVQIARYALIGAMIALCVMTMQTLVGRYFFDGAPPMLEELSGFVFVWISFVAAAVVLYQNGHPRIEFVVAIAPRRLGECLKLSAQVAVLSFFAAMVWYGWQMVMSSSGTTAPTSGISMAFLYSSLLVGSALAVLYTLTTILTEVQFTLARAALAVVIFAVIFLALSRIIQLPDGFVFGILALIIVVMLVIGMPIGIALASASLMAVALTSHLPLLLIPQKMVDGLDSFVLVCVPLYLLVGGLMASGSTAARLLGIANALVGWIRGGIGLADVVASALFADISGSAVSDVAAIGAVVGPELIRRGFRPEQAAALQAAAGVQGILFPPSLTMIVYAWVSDVSLSQLFLNLFIPGLLVMISFMLVVYIMARRNGLQAQGKPSASEIWHAFKRGFLVLWTPVIILGGIVSGFATTTEVGVLAVAYAFILEVLVYRDVPLKQLGDVIFGAALITGRIGIIVASARRAGLDSRRQRRTATHYRCAHSCGAQRARASDPHQYLPDPGAHRLGSPDHDPGHRTAIDAHSRQVQCQLGALRRHPQSQFGDGLNSTADRHLPLHRIVHDECADFQGCSLRAAIRCGTRHRSHSGDGVSATLDDFCSKRLTAHGRERPTGRKPKSDRGNLTLVASGDSLIVRRLPQPLPSELAALSHLIRSADVSFTNLETILRRDEGFPQAECGGSTWIWSDPEVLDDLHVLGFKLFGTAQNHMLDWGQEGLLACLRYLDVARAIHAGAGADLAAARRPVYLATPQGRVALIAATSTFLEGNRAGTARQDCQGRPGINPLGVRPGLQLAESNFRMLRALSASLGLGSLPPQVKGTHPHAADRSQFMLLDHVVTKAASDAVTYELNERDRTAIIKTIADARGQADWVLFSFHSHEMTHGDPETAPDHLRTFMRDCIDAGADAVLGHGAHLLRGMEIYKSRPILHGLGNFIFENEMLPYPPSDFYEGGGLGPDAVPDDGFDKRTDHGRKGFPADPRFWEGALATCTWADGKLDELLIHPVVLGYGKQRQQRGRSRPCRRRNRPTNRRIA